MRVVVPGRTIPTNFVRVADERHNVHSELTGPVEAFEFIEGETDMVRVVKPELVKIETFERIG